MIFNSSVYLERKVLNKFKFYINPFSTMTLRKRHKPPYKLLQPGLAPGTFSAKHIPAADNPLHIIGQRAPHWPSRTFTGVDKN